LSNNLPRLLREFSRDYERRIWQELAARGYPEIRPPHSLVFANLGMGSVRVSELAKRAQVTQQAMGKMLKELERMGYIARDVDSSDKRAKEIRLTDKGVQLAADCLEVVDDVREYYDSKVGTADLALLEQELRNAVKKLELEYLPESWVDGDQ
jgi:DNA-binding MarR family transcriptional regulator